MGSDEIAHLYVGEASAPVEGERPMAEFTLLLVFALYAGVMGLIFQMFDR